jgi:hypothetical protein
MLAGCGRSGAENPSLSVAGVCFVFAAHIAWHYKSTLNVLPINKPCSRKKAISQGIFAG